MYNRNSSLLFRYSLMAVPLSFLGIPLYLHLPKFYNDYYGLSLEVIGLILMFSRIFDALIDPLLGAISDKYNFTRPRYFLLFSLGLIFFFNAFFYFDKDYNNIVLAIWFAICTIGVYLFFSLMFINYYNLGLYISKDNSLKVPLSSYRELASFFGLIFASIMPLFLAQIFEEELIVFISYGVIFSSMVIVSLITLPKVNIQKKTNNIGHTFYNIILANIVFVYKNLAMRLLLIIFFINSLPLAITANLLSFYSDEVLNAKEYMPLFLLCYLCSGGIGALICSIFFKNANKITILLYMMIISAISFSITCFLSPSTSYIFYLVCIISGIGVGGELSMLPAIAADVLDDFKDYGNTFFALWNSVYKITLALGAGIFLPLISISDQFLTNIPLDSKIKVYYAIIPLIIKIAAIMIIIIIRSKNIRGLK